MMHISVAVFYVILLCFQKVLGTTFQNVEGLNQRLSNISRDIKPRIDQSLPVNIDILMSVGAIQDYDGISGTLTFTASFALFWEDETKSWNPDDYGGIRATKLSVLKTWVPTLILRNGATAYTLYRYDNNIHAENALVYYDAYGKASFQVFGQYDVTCDSDVTYYPFDEHKCAIIVITTDIMNDLTLTSDFEMHLGASMPNSEWMIESNASYTIKSSLTVENLNRVFTLDQIEFTLIISRQFFFPLLNIVLPVILLSLVSILVFLLPVESGERTSFSFTLLLTFVVFMTNVAERLPASNDVSLFNLFLVGQLFSSILATLFVVLGIRLFYKDLNNQKLNIWYRIILKLYTFSHKDMNCKKRIGNHEGGTDKIIKERPSSKELTAFYDRICIWIFGLGSGVYFVVYGLAFHYGYVNKL